MPRYIDADALYEEVKKREETARQWVLDAPSSFNGNPNPAAIRYAAILGERTTMMHMIYDASTAEVAPVRRGKWVYGENEGQDGWYCSECHFFIPWYYDWYGLDNIDFIKDFHACPHCSAKMVTYTGAKMDKGEE